jgi:hypothetical protein
LKYGRRVVQLAVKIGVFRPDEKPVGGSIARCHRLSALCSGIRLKVQEECNADNGQLADTASS